MPSNLHCMTLAWILHLRVLMLLWLFPTCNTYTIKNNRKKPSSGINIDSVQFSHSVVSDSLRPQASVSITNSWNLLKVMSMESVMPFTHLILCCPLLLLPSIFPSIIVFSVSQIFASGGQSIGASASASVLPVNTQYWFPLGLPGLMSLKSKGLSRIQIREMVSQKLFQINNFKKESVAWVSVSFSIPCTPRMP